MFDETVQPVCSPALLRDPKNQLKKPADLANLTLLTMDMPAAFSSTTDWEPWLEVIGAPELRTKNTLRFSLWTDSIGAAIAGQDWPSGAFRCLPNI